MVRVGHRNPLFLLAITAGCASGERPAVTCGIAALAGPYVVLEAFGKGNALDRPPSSTPASLPVRFVGGPVLRGIVGRVDSTGWVIGAEGEVPPSAKPGYGVLIVDRSGVAHGVLLFDGPVVPGAALLGSVGVRDTLLPLVGVRMNPAEIGDSACAVFPDSAR